MHYVVIQLALAALTGGMAAINFAGGTEWNALIGAFNAAGSLVILWLAWLTFRNVRRDRAVRP